MTAPTAEPAGPIAAGSPARPHETLVDRLGQRPLCGPVAFRALSYGFELHWQRPESVEMIRQALGAFEVPWASWQKRHWPPAPEVGEWHILDSGPAHPRRHVAFHSGRKYHDGSDLALLVDSVLWAINQEVLRASRNFLVIHAGAVSLAPGVAAVLPGHSGSGKSSLVAGLVQAGLPYLSDEFAPVDPVSGTLHSYPRAITLKPGSLRLFPGIAGPGAASARAQRHLCPEHLGGSTVTGPHRVGLIVFPTYRAGSRTRATPLRAAETVAELGRHALGMGAFGGRALPLLAALAQGAPAYRLVVGDLVSAVETVRGLSGGPG